MYFIVLYDRIHWIIIPKSFLSNYWLIRKLLTYIWSWKKESECFRDVHSQIKCSLTHFVQYTTRPKQCVTYNASILFYCCKCWPNEDLLDRTKFFGKSSLEYFDSTHCQREPVSIDCVNFNWNVWFLFHLYSIPVWLNLHSDRNCLNSYRFSSKDNSRGFIRKFNTADSHRLFNFVRYILFLY